jgi:hypothetical protein
MTKFSWRKSSYSTAQSNCVEAASMPGLVAVRDSKNPDGGHLVLTRAAWRHFADRIKAERN